MKLDLLPPENVFGVSNVIFNKFSFTTIGERKITKSSRIYSAHCISSTKILRLVVDEF